MRLLLIEDNERFAALLKRGLVGAGFVVDVLSTAADAVTALSSEHFEIIILDLGLPDGDGIDLLAEMRQRGDATPVLILTARGGLKDRVAGLGNGADDYLVKPFALEELVARLRAVLRRPGTLLSIRQPHPRHRRAPSLCRQSADLLLATRDRRS
jgi:DNA-binding response OmpR family regulator